MRADGTARALPRWLLACVTLAAVTGAARAADVSVLPGRAGRDVSTLAARETVLADQAADARARARGRLRALYRLVTAGRSLSAVTRARAADAGTRALFRDLGEARTLAAERARVHAERAAVGAAAETGLEIGAPPWLTLPVAGPVVARFGEAPDPTTGVVVSRAGVRLKVAALQPVRAPAAGTVSRSVLEPGGMVVVLDHGAGWTSIIGNLVGVTLAAGERVAAGQRLGVATPDPAGAASAVTFEVWRGRRPVDPLLLVAGGRRSPLAASVGLP
jgi:murein hydrolase activator